MVVSVTLDFVRDVCFDEWRVSMGKDDVVDINARYQGQAGGILQNRVPVSMAPLPTSMRYSLSGMRKTPLKCYQ